MKLVIDKIVMPGEFDTVAILSVTTLDGNVEAVNKHRDRTGPNNPFWGKIHTVSTKATSKETCKDATRKMWEDESYRSLVIERMTGLTRSDEFKETLTMEDFKASMEGIYTTCVSTGTIDESPMAYKPMDEILANIEPTCDVVKIIKPIYNFKASEAD